MDDPLRLKNVLLIGEENELFLVKKVPQCLGK